MSQKDIKKMMIPLASVIALGAATFLGLSAEESTMLENAIVGGSTAILTILGIFGVWKNNDKDSNM